MLIILSTNISECRCTSDNDPGYPAYCASHDGGTTSWCYLAGGLNAASCPGATQSDDGSDIYYTRDADVCEGNMLLRNGDVKSVKTYMWTYLYNSCEQK